MVKNNEGEITQTLAPFTQELSGKVERATSLIQKAEGVPSEAKKAIKEWFIEKLDSLTKNDIENLVDILPDDILGFIETIKGILLQVL
jgi:hypothetical protein